MALTIKHLNTDASFQLTFTPLTPPSLPPPPPFHILLDPWITGASHILHPSISLTRHKHPACITSLAQLPPPDLVIISQAKSDHCHEATLRQLPRDGPTLILAAPAAARIIRSWRHFDPRKVRALARYRGNTVAVDEEEDAVTRIPFGGPVGGEQEQQQQQHQRGEVSVAWIPQRRDLTGLHAAVGITFRSLGRRGAATMTAVATPPATPRSWRSGTADLLLLPPEGPLLTPLSPTTTLRSTRSASTLTTLTPTLTNTSTLAGPASAQPQQQQQQQQAPRERTLSLLFSPHGMPFAGPLATYATTHLVAEAALPLTALLHCFDRVSNPWWLGGTVLLGAPAGREIAVRLGARAWVRCHDGAKEVRGLATGWLRTRRWGREEVQRGVWEEEEEEGEVKQEHEEGLGGWRNRGLGRPATAGPGRAAHAPRTFRSGSPAKRKVGGKGTQVLDLASGEEVVLTAEGVWHAADGQLACGSCWLGDAETDPSVFMESKTGFQTFDEVMGSGPPLRSGARCC